MTLHKKMLHINFVVAKRIFYVLFYVNFVFGPFGRECDFIIIENI